MRHRLIKRQYATSHTVPSRGHIASSPSRPQPSCVGEVLRARLFYAFIRSAPSGLFLHLKRARRGLKGNSGQMSESMPKSVCSKSRKTSYDKHTEQFFNSWGGVRQFIWYAGGHWAYCTSPYTIHEYGAIRGMRTERGKPRCSENPHPSATSSIKKAYITWPRTEPGLPRWETSD